MCDTCLSPPETWDGTVAAQKMLSTVYRSCGVSVGRASGLLILLIFCEGKETIGVKQHDHTSLTVFIWRSTDLSVKEWRSVLRQLIAYQLVWCNLKILYAELDREKSLCLGRPTGITT